MITELGNLRKRDKFVYENMEYTALSATGNNSVWCMSANGKRELFYIGSLVMVDEQENEK